MRGKFMTGKLLYLFLTVGIMTLDQASKYWAEKILTEKVVIEIIPYFFSLELAHNEGIAFSLPLPPLVVILLTVLVCFYLVWEIFIKNQHFIFYLLILAGALGNLVDRLWHGYVIDMFAVHYFAIFNLADVWISLGVVGWIFYEWRGLRKERVGKKPV
jgi:signal peptidase II